MSEEKGDVGWGPFLFGLFIYIAVVSLISMHQTDIRKLGSRVDALEKAIKVEAPK